MRQTQTPPAPPGRPGDLGASNQQQAPAVRAQIDAAREQAAAARQQAAEAQRMAAQIARDAAQQVGQTVIGVPAPPATPPFRNEPSAGLIIAALCIVFIGFPLAVAFARRLFRGPTVSAKAIDDQSARLARLEQSLDAVAIEIERISEGQRFVTKLMTEAKPELLAASQEGKK